MLLWNGVFNPSRVTQHGKTHEFTCAMFRIHPRTREFEVFCEGTSNPWGIAWDVEGSAFSSAWTCAASWACTVRASRWCSPVRPACLRADA